MKGCLSRFCFPKKKATVAVSKVSTLLHISAEPVEGKIKAILLPKYLLPLHQLVVGGMFSCDLDEVLKSLYLCVCVCICVQKEGSKGRTAQTLMFPSEGRISKAQANPLLCCNADRGHASKLF